MPQPDLVPFAKIMTTLTHHRPRHCSGCRARQALLPALLAARRWALVRLLEPGRGARARGHLQGARRAQGAHLLSRAPACMATAHPGIDLIDEAIRSYAGTRLGLGLQVAPPKHASWDGGPGLESRMKAAGLLVRDGSGQLELARLSLGSTP